MSVVDNVTELLGPVIDTLGVELIDVEWVGSSLRIVVDEADGITTDRLADVNRLISPILDQHDPVPGRYTLEVSSPGVERKLTKPLHYARAIGEDVVVKLEAGNEPRRVKGRLSAFDEAAGTITVEAVELDGVDLASPETHLLALADIAKTRTVFAWGPTPKIGGPSGAKKAAKKSAAKAKPDQRTAGQPRPGQPKAKKQPKVKQQDELDPPPSSEPHPSSTRSEASRHE
ncbi:MAG: ribosome maturation factor RimP [Acidimicrobiales bacterium]